MGVYINHGLEYRIRLRPEAVAVAAATAADVGSPWKLAVDEEHGHLVFLSMKQVGARLLRSRYYTENRSRWIGSREVRESYAEEVAEQGSVDVYFTEEEQGVWIRLWEAVRWHASGHGWYEVSQRRPI